MSASPLLRLPGELRNKIFEFALASAEPLRYRPLRMPALKAILYAPRRPVRLEGEVLQQDLAESHQYQEFNQLKFVNKQLYAETAGLEIRYNTIVFAARETHRRSATKQFLDFLTEMKPSKVSWLTTLILEELGFGTILDGEDILNPDLQKVFTFCKQNTGTEVRYQISRWNIDEGSMRFFSAGAWVIRHMKGAEAGIQVNEKLFDMPTKNQLSDWVSGWSSIQGLLKGVDNFAFWPAADATDIRQHIIDEAAKITRCYGYGEEQFAQWRHYATLWVEHGINATE